ncbi:Not1-domain-containing protein [Backusella circina FSU 941]|nr:Not1-domain-containing protein [Backusella circina FSU 941]
MNLLKASIIEMYTTNPSNVTQILHLTEELKVFPSILEVLPFDLSLDLASFAAQSGFQSAPWLKTKLQEEGNIDQCLEFLNKKMTLELTFEELPAENMPLRLSIDMVQVFLAVLSSSIHSPEKIEHLQVIQSQCKQAYPQLANREEKGMGESGISFKPEIENEANSYYEGIYSGTLSVNSMIQLLQKLHQSQDSHDQEVFACMIHNLFDEYLFFPKYPEKELSITSVLFGSLIQHRLVAYVPLGIALRCVLESLRNPPGSKMFNFGVQALQQFKGRLSEWTQYCTHILQIPDFVQAQPELASFIQNAMKQKMHPSDELISQQPIELDHTNTLSTNNNQENNIAIHPTFKSMNLPKFPTSEEEQIIYADPVDSIQAKILFIVNNVAHNNVETKVPDLQTLLKPAAYKWFSSYLVVSRVSLEINQQPLYLLVLDLLNSKLLVTHVLYETYCNIQILLNSEKTVSSSSERTLLKNLGSWLGRLTLGKNKPIKQSHISFKDLLLEGYDSNRLIVVIPFVCKILEQCSESKVFKPPNPWLMAILKLLVELYDSADLKLNLKFEIEVLCKGLSIELKDIKPTSILKNRRSQMDREARAAQTAHDPFATKSLSDSKLLGHADVAGASGNGGGTESSESLIANLAPFINFNPQISLYTTQPGIKRWVLQSFAESLSEIIGPVVERAVAIAVVSTRDLVTKDFITEADENRVRSSAQLMAQNLAASLATVTSREPLRMNIASKLRTLFMSHGLNENTAEQAVILTLADNLDIACAIIEKAAGEKATVEIDDAMTHAYTIRKKYREQRSNSPFIDMDAYPMMGYPKSLPPMLIPKPGGLQSAQLNIYKDFARIPRSMPGSGTPINSNRVNRGEGPVNYGYNNNSMNSPITKNVGFDGSSQMQQQMQQQQQQQQMSAHVILERFSQLMMELERQLNQTNVSHVNALPAQHDIRIIVRQIPMLAISSFDKTETARTFAQDVVQLLYKSEESLSIQVYVILLEHLCKVSPNVGTLVTSWLTHADDERKYNVPVTAALILAGLVNLPEMDQELAILIESGRVSAIEFTAQLIKACVYQKHPIAARQEFTASIEALMTLRGKVPESVLLLMDDMRNSSVSLAQGQLPIQGQAQDRFIDHAQYLFAEWVRLYQHAASTNQTLMSYVEGIYNQNLFKVNNGATLFYRVCIEASIEHALKFKSAYDPSSSRAAYQPIDAFSKLLVSLIQLPEITNQGQQIHHFAQALSAIVVCINQLHSTHGQHFDQRPFLRLFTSILSDLHASEQEIQPYYFQLLSTLSSVFLKLQPSEYPGFSFAWLQLISHRFFMPQLLLGDNLKGWDMFQKLFVSLLQFLVPYLHNAELWDTTRMLYRGTLRVLLVLLHDFPEFLCDYHMSFCDMIPSTCIQLRNLMLSAFPRNMRLPDPFTPNLKVDLLPGIDQPPRVLSDYTSILTQNQIKSEIDQLVDAPKNATTNLILQKFKLEQNDSDYNVPLVNSTVFYMGVSILAKGIPAHQGAPMEVYQRLLSELDSHGRYLFLSAIANQLRYPNNHTHYFSCVLLYLFSESKEEAIKEQITRVLLERLIVNRPHPWGLLITFIELIKNPSYSFWSHSFTRCAADIERLFESVSRSISQI